MHGRGDGRSQDNLHLIVVGQLFGGEDGAPQIVIEAIIQQVKSAQYPAFCRWPLGVIIVVCKKVGMGLCAPPSLPALALRKLGAVPSNVDR